MITLPEWLFYLMLVCTVWTGFALLGCIVVIIREGIRDRIDRAAEKKAMEIAEEKDEQR